MQSAFEALVQCFCDGPLNASLWEESSFPAAGSVATRAIAVDLGEPSVMLDFFSGIEEPYKFFMKGLPDDWPEVTGSPMSYRVTAPIFLLWTIWPHSPIVNLPQ